MIADARIKQIFVALRLHFTSKYDFVKYSGKMKFASPVKPAEAYPVGKIQKKYQDEDKLIAFFVSNMISEYIKENKFNTFIGSYSSKESNEIYDQWQAWWNAAEYNFSQDIRDTELSIKELIQLEDSDHPMIFRLHIDNKININTIVCLSYLIPKLFDYWLKTSKDTILFHEYINMIKKYRVFISFDHDKMKKVLDNLVSI